MFITAGFFTLLLKHFEEIPVNISRIFSKDNTNLHLLDNPVAKIDAGILGEYLEIVVAKSKNNRIGLETGFILPFTMTGAIFNIYHPSTNVREIFQNIDSFDPIINTISQYSGKESGDYFCYEISVSEEFSTRYPIASRQWSEMEYGIGLQYAHSFTGRYLHPVLAHSIHQKEGDPDKLEEYLGCPVIFGQDKFRLFFNKSILDLPLITAKQDLLPIFSDYMNEIRIQEYHQDKLSEIVRHYLMQIIMTEHLSLQSIADKCHMGERSIQRKLKAEGTSYQDILNTLRIELSRKYLKQHIPLQEISHLLGFESQSAFNKFFRKHFQAAPKDIQNRI